MSIFSNFFEVGRVCEMVILIRMKDQDISQNLGRLGRNVTLLDFLPIRKKDSFTLIFAFMKSFFQKEECYIFAILIC